VLLIVLPAFAFASPIAGCSVQLTNCGAFWKVVWWLGGLAAWWVALFIALLVASL